MFLRLIIIGEFRKALNNFTTLFEDLQQYTTDNVPSGFAINDFDNDGKTELIAHYCNGIIYSY